MQLFQTIDAVRDRVRFLQRSGQTVGLVPTMGALHRGHLSLVEAARSRCAAVAVTIFVNPTQFSPTEDFSAYPRPLEADLAACQTAGVDLVFAPGVETLYPSDARTAVHVAQLTDGLCGPHRPGHFDGVATVVAKLLHILPADAAFFGEKDYQQLMVIRRMVRDLNMPVEIVGCPIVREPDGLAMSSRNIYLSPREREQATCLHRALHKAVEKVRAGKCRVADVVQGIREDILAAGPAIVDYVDVVDAETLELLPRTGFWRDLTLIDRPARVCLAVRIGACRLIDNIAVDAPPTSK